MRRVITVLFLLGILGGVAWTLLTWGKDNSGPADPWRAIPSTAAVVVEVPDPLNTWERVTRTAQLWGAVRNMAGMIAMDSLVQRASRAMEANGVKAPLTSALIALIPLGEHDPELLVVWPVSDARALSAVAGALGMKAVATDAPVAVQPDKALLALQVRHVDGLLMIGTSANVLDEAEQHRRSASREHDEGLEKARAAFGSGADAHVLVNMAHLPRLLGSWLKPEVVDAMHLPTGWASLDLRSRPDALLLGGLLVPDKGETSLATLFTSVNTDNTLLRELPAAVDRFTLQHVSDVKHELTERHVPDSLISLFSWVHGPVAVASAGAETDSSAMRFAVFTTDDVEASHHLDALMCAAAPNAWPQYRNTSMMGMCCGDALERTWGPSFSGFEHALVAWQDQHVVFCSNERAFKALVDSWADGTTLRDDARTVDLFQRFGTEAARTQWCDVGRMVPALRANTLPGASATIDANAGIWQQLGGFLLQLAPSRNGEYYVSIALTHVSDRSAAVAVGSDVLWSAQIGAALSAGPFVLQDHATKARMLLVQDTLEHITLFTSIGQQLWTRELDGRIMGDVHQVDRFKNGKLQLLFNTASRIYLIDRNGKDVDGFPITLKEKASAPVAVFDYENTREYRMLLPTVEAHVLNLGLDAKPTTGWTSPTLAHTCSEAVRFLRIHGKDHLLAVDRSGKVNVWDRKGTVRYTAKLTLPDSATLIDVRPALEIGNVQLMWSEPNGAVSAGQLDGASASINRAMGARARMAKINGKDASLRWTADSLVIVQGSAPVINVGFSSPILAPPRTSDDNIAGTVIAVACANGIHLLDASGMELPGSPFPGTSHFSVADINHDGSHELITSTTEGRIVVTRLPLEPR